MIRQQLINHIPMNSKGSKMVFKVVACALAGFALAGCAGSDGMMKNGAMSGAGDMQSMSMKQCQEHMAMRSKAGMQMDSGMMKMDDMCKDMMMKQGGSMPMGTK
jgi:hypothetical protein